MIELIIKLIIFTIMPISGFFVIKNLIDSDEKKMAHKIRFWILCAICMYCQNDHYNKSREHSSSYMVTNLFFL